MNVDLIDMNAFVMDDEEDTETGGDSEQAPLATKHSDGSDTNSSHAVTTVDFLEDDEIGLRDHSEASVLTSQITNPYNLKEKPKINLVRDEGHESFFQNSFVWRCLACINLGDYTQYFDVTTKDVLLRLKYTLVGHFTRM